MSVSVVTALLPGSVDTPRRLLALGFHEDAHHAFSDITDGDAVESLPCK
jgi:hypothetical protein